MPGVEGQGVVETLGGGSQPDMVEARQMEALSLAVHIPIVCFGIAFPATVPVRRGLYLRTGDETYKALAKRWSKVALVLFAVGVVTGTILSFEFGLLWPEFMASFGEVFGVAFGLEGISFFVEAIFIAIYVYGGRLSRRAHFLTGVPVVISGFTGTFTVLSVNARMNNPQGFDVGPRPLFALLLASAGVAVPLMLIFEAPLTRIVGVLGRFTFIVSGVFVIADPAFLGSEEEDAA